MDVLKLTFETTVVGILAFLWLGIAVDLISPSFLTRAKSALDEVNPNLTGVVVLAAAYCLGSAILPISDQLVNDEHWPLPEDAIRCRVAVEEGRRLRLVRYAFPPTPGDKETYTDACSCSYWNRLRGGNHAAVKNVVQGASPGITLDYGRSQQVRRDSDAEAQRKTVLKLFELHENEALGQGANKEELFRQLRERIIVLRGAVFSGFVLFLICLFGCIAPAQGQPFNWKRSLPGIVLASCLTVFVVHSGYEDLANPNIFDIPILESVLGAITVFGGFLAVNGVRRRPFMRARLLVVIALGAALSYGGWMWSEVLYDQQVIDSSAVLETRSEPSTISPGRLADQPTSMPERPEMVYQAVETTEPGSSLRMH
jgi:hypothetical protein